MRSHPGVLFRLVLGLCFVGLFRADTRAAELSQQRATYVLVTAKAADYLLARGNEQGSYSKQAGPGVTALITTALLRNGRSSEEPPIARSLKYLEGMVRDNGGIYQEGTLYRNYETCLAMMCFSAANKDGRYTKIIAKADAFVQDLQWDESEDKDYSDPAYGGAGYGKHGRPDMSNTQFLLDALRAAGHDENSEAVQKILVFVSRCQNLENEYNTTPFAAKVGDGGFYYTCAAGGSSQAGSTATGGLRSYASMTYAGLKSMIYAGVGPEDPRVKAAVSWIQKNYDLDSNPGLGQEGVFYYYHTFAKTLEALGQDKFVDDQGVEHDWRAELVAELASRQQADGSFVNPKDRWMEGDANLVTGYALMALSYCRPVQK